ncbi:MAG: protein kinase [Planctomycetaceae bacterium]|jgi:eukaryotic-like serine/threonine-protein kinase|nr:protein kinase [Planctomycetaceae bacterium]MBT6496127.1 protein kinase [Planctomycetaceae bacterium]
MSANKTCPDCGTELPPDAPAGVCPKCLLQAGLNESPTDAADAETLVPDSEALADAPTILPSDHAKLAAGTTPPIGATIKYFGDYELLDEIARGGMGVVYKARQVRLNRTVALKMILAGQFAGEADVQRFQTEAEAAAQLDHPGIVPVFEVGEFEGHHFFSMGLVEGDSLAARIADSPLPPKEAAELVRQIADAIQYAHDKGVIHRDLKPANILLDREGHPKITDFGLAKKIGGDSNLTATGQVMGTPSYMPPEQASGRIDQVNEAADIYSLGAVLYATLSGRPPFQADNPLDTLMQVLEREPVSPRTLSPKVPLDLETICLKCLEKDRRRRYRSARELAGELQRFLDGKAILARPISRPARLWRWCKRKPVVASLTVAVIVSLIGGVFFSTHFALEEREARKNAVQRKHEAESSEKQAQDLARKNALLADQHRRARDRAKRQAALAELGTYNVQLLRVQDVWEENPGLALDLLNDTVRCPKHLRDFAWGHYYQLSKRDLLTLTGHKYAVSCVAFSPDGKSLASASYDGTVKLWDSETGEEKRTLDIKLQGDGEAYQVTCVAYSPDGNTLASAGWDGTIRLWDVASGKKNATLKGHTGFVWSVAFSPDGKTLATGGGTQYEAPGQLRLWDVVTGQQKAALIGHKQLIFSVAFSPDGKSLASSGWSNTTTIWDALTGKKRATFAENSETDKTIDSVSFSQDGRTLVTVARSGSKGRMEGPGEVRLRDTETGHVQSMFEVEPLGAISFGTSRIAFSADGETVALPCRDASVRLYDITSGREHTRFRHGDTPTCVAFSGDGKILASAGNGRIVKLWSAEPQGKITFQGTVSHATTSTVFSPNGKTLASVGVFLPDEKTLTSGIVKGATSLVLRDSESGRKRSLLSEDPGEVRCVAFSPDSNTLATATACTITQVAQSGNPKVGENKTKGTHELGEVKLWNLQTGELRKTLKRHDVHRLLFSPDGSTLASAGGHDSRNSQSQTGLRLWDVFTGQERETRPEQTGVVRFATFSPDGKTLAYTDGKLIKLWDVRTRNERHSFEGHTTFVTALAFSPSGKLLASGSAYGDKTVKLWDTATGRRIATLTGHVGGVSSVIFSPDGKTLASAATGSNSRTKVISGQIKLWDTEPARERATINSHSGGIACIAFSPDGKTLVSGGGIDKGKPLGELKLWDAVTGQERATLKGHTGPVVSVAFSPDGRRLVSSSSGQSIRLQGSRKVVAGQITVWKSDW